MRKIAAVTVSRSDFGILSPVFRRIQRSPRLGLELIVAGMHLAPEFGSTVRAVEAEGFPIRDRIEMLLSSDTPEAVAKSMGLGMLGFAQAYARSRPDLLLVLGDRFETHAAVAAALPFAIPIAHIHGGEVTEGAIDDALRHSITKMSHLHFAATQEASRRIVQMGEAPWRVVVSGAPGLDNVREARLLDAGELASRFGIDVTIPTLLVTYHPVTLAHGEAAAHLEELLAAIEESGLAAVFTYPNADAEGRRILERLRAHVGVHQRSRLVGDLGTAGYLSVMRHATAMVGNSSSGIIEAASFELPVVDVGDRQKGRLRGANVLHAPPERGAILAAIREASTPAFRRGLVGLSNPYGDGRAAERIVERLEEVELGPELIRKRFHAV